MLNLVMLGGLHACLFASASAQVAWRVVDERVVQLLDGQSACAATPSEGLWTVGLGWKDGWPAEWRHAAPVSSELVGGWTVLRGALSIDGGEMLLRDAYREEDGVLRARRRYEWRGERPLRQATLTVRWLALDAPGALPFHPGISFHGNPSGAHTSGVDLADRSTHIRAATVVQTGGAGERSWFEEHRHPLPFACVEWDAHVLALHTTPSPVPGAHRRDQWWSLGVESFSDRAELGLLSGPCAANGRNSVVKARQGEFMAYDETWLDLAPGAVVEKEYAVELARVSAPSQGFRTPLATSLRRAAPFERGGLPKARDIVASKLAFARSRWREGPGHAGFEMYPDFVDGTHYVVGWAGQSEAVPWVLLQMEGKLDWPDARTAAIKAFDTLSSAPFDEWGFAQHLHVETGAWTERDPVSQGQALESFTRAIAAARAKGVNAKKWEVFVVRAANLQAERLLAPGWRAPSTAECFLVSPLLRAARLFGDARHAEAALRVAEEAAARHMGATEPYWGGTLDARCEDKEGAWAAFQAFLAAHDHAVLLGDEVAARRWLDRAAHAMDAVLSWTMTWDVDLPPGRLADHGFRSRGWTVVSAQNQHLDVYGVLYTPEIWRMGALLGRPELQDLAKLMYRTCGQLLDETGSAGEQIQHTNFAQAGDMSQVERMRGGYSEGWTVFWITAHFLHALARFDELGVPIEELDR
jgi:hypothetical protein